MAFPPVRKAVIPAGGLSTRMLPATKSVPKEMLPLVDRPLIHYSVEEAILSGLREVCIVSSRGKTAIEDYFDTNLELESALAQRNKSQLLSIVQSLNTLAEISYVRQGPPRGLGHAVSRAQVLVGHEPFAVILPDDVIDAQPPCLKQLLQVYEHYGRPVLALMEVPEEQISAYGIVAVEPLTTWTGPGRLFRILDMVEKPPATEAPSNLAIIGRYVLTPEIFAVLQTLPPGAGGEIQLTDGIRQLLQQGDVYGLCFAGRRYDAGDRLGYLQAIVEFGLKHPDVGEPFRQYLIAMGQRLNDLKSQSTSRT